MINFTIPDDVLAEVAVIEQIARDIMRPQSRYYDEHEHERPSDFINAIWPLEREKHKQKLAGLVEKKFPNTAALSMILGIEMLAWADAGNI